MAPRVTLLPLLLHLAAAACPTVTCADLPPNMCARQVSDDKFLLNWNGCEDGYVCQLTDFMEWESIALLQTLSYSCVPDTTSVNMTETGWVSTACRTREYRKDFPSRKATVLCDSDEDCLLEDGTFSTCVCVPRSDAKGVCQPHPSNQVVYSPYWTACSRFGTQSLASRAEYLYYEYSLNYAVYEMTDLLCVGHFEELKTKQTLWEEFNWASVCAVSALLSFF